MNQDVGSSPGTDPFSFLARGGEMGERVRGFDWSTTPVGPAEQWPQSLKIAIRIMLGSRYAMWLGWGPEFTFFYNDAYAAMTLGPKHPWALGRPTREVWSEIWSDIGPRAEQVIRTGEATWDEALLLFVQRRGFPEESYHTFSYSPVPDDGGGVGGMLCVVTEETERVIGERRLRTLRDLGARTTENARSVEDACVAAARTLAENPHDLPFIGIYLLDRDASTACLAAATGLPEGAGASPQEIDLSLPDEDGWPLAETLKTGKPIVVTDVEERFGALRCPPWPDPVRYAAVVPIARPGQTRPAGFLVAGVSPRLVLDDAYVGFLELVAGHVATAIANVVAYEEERRRAEALAQLDQAKTAFFSNVSHEFRTPLTLMLGPVEDLLREDETDLPPAAKGQLEVVNRNGRRLLRLVNTLLDFSRIEAGRARATFEPTDLSAFTQDLASVFRSACERAGLRLKVDCPPLSEPVYVDPEMWEKIVLNLLSNAFKFTFEGQIEVSLWKVDGQAELRVRDTGTGIPAEELPRLFERFHRVRSAQGRSHEGSGIGLALVQELVRLHGGSVEVESALGEGTTFIVTLPLGAAHLPPDQVRRASAGVVSGGGAAAFLDEALRWLPEGEADEQPLSADVLPDYSGPQRDAAAERPRVLVADDNPDMRQYVLRLLEGRFEVEGVGDGQAALQAVRERRPDLVLTDVMMPRLDGFGLLRELRADPATGGLPVVMLSARAGEESRVEGLEAGADDYLVKPFSARELLARVSAHIQLSRLRREVARREAELSESEARLRNVFDQTTAGIAQVDLNGRFLLVNRGFCEITGYSEVELYENTCAGITHPEDRACDEMTFRAAVAERTPSVLEKRYVRPDGSTVWVRNSLSEIPNEAGEPKAMLAVSIDISDRKQAEQTLIRQSERLRLLWEAAAVLMTADDPDTMLGALFAKIAPHLGADAYFNFMVNPSGDALQLGSCAGVPDEVVEQIRTLDFGAAVCGVVAQIGEPIVATRIQESDDPRVQLVRSLGIRAYACNPLITGETLLGTLSFASRTRDEFDPDEITFLETISQYVTVAYERLRLLRELRETDRRKDEFLAMLAHELRNPLAPIRTAVRTLELRGPDDPLLHRHRQIIERQVQNMARLLDDLLEVSRVTRGLVRLRREPVELRALVEQCLEANQPLLEQRGHRIEVDLGDEPLPVFADPLRLEQVTTNLLNNAGKYTPDGGTVRIRAYREEDTAVLCVTDDGRGIESDLLPHVFDLFRQGEQGLDRSQGGLGIGLTMVKGLVELHGGAVRAFSDGPGRGAEFHIRLPLTQSVKTPRLETSRSSDGTGLGGRAAGPRRKVLFVDDNRDGADALAELAEHWGFEASTAYDGAAALRLIGEQTPDAAVLDIGMPGMDGYETARRLRSDGVSKDLRLIALTGYGLESDRERAREAGFDAHLTKPVDPEEVCRTLRSLLDGGTPNNTAEQ